MRSISPDLHPSAPTMFRPDEIESILRQRCDLEVKYDFCPLLGPEDAAFTPLVSSQILPAHWALIARTIQHHYDSYDGFVVLHGTDTMAWTASALSFMFSNLSKPIVVTGSQRPILAAPSDAVPNFVNSVLLAGRGQESIPLLPEVVVCFGDLVLRGNRTTKTSAASLQGFDSPNAQHLGRIGRRFDINVEQIRSARSLGEACFARLQLEQRVADVVLYPGIPANQLKHVLEGNAGAVLRTFGAGNAPGGPEVEEVLRAAASGGKVLVNVTQCNEGTVEAGMLTGTRALTECGVVSGLDLTAEAALTKLMVLLGSETPDIARQQMQLDQRGEQSMDSIELQMGARPDCADGVSRVTLTSSLHARARPDRLANAVLRVRLSKATEGFTPPTAVAIYLNNWRAGHRAERDLRCLGTHTFAYDAVQGRFTIVLEVTQVCRRVVEPGSPVTVTIVPSGRSEPVEFEVILSMFMDRSIGENRESA